MTKWILSIGLVALVAIILIYLLIPQKLTISAGEAVHCNAAAASRALDESIDWKQWWPPDPAYHLNITHRLSSEKGFRLGDSPFAIPCQLFILPGNGLDSSSLTITSQLSGAGSPWGRIGNYRRAVSLREKMDSVLLRLKAFLELSKNLYGMDIKPSMSKDSALVVTLLNTSAYPSTAEIYQAIHDIRKFIAAHQAMEVNAPMIRVSTIKAGVYETMIAIPTNRLIPTEGKFFPRKFVPWKILYGDVRGGPVTGEKALQQLQDYLGDYQRTGMAISFQSLITERDQQPDSTQWITRVIVPVF